MLRLHGARRYGGFWLLDRIRSRERPYLGAIELGQRHNKTPWRCINGCLHSRHSRHRGITGTDFTRLWCLVHIQPPHG